VCDGLDHPEGITWGPDGFAYAGGEAGQIYRIDLEARTFEQIGSTGGFALGLALDGAGGIYVCDSKRRAVTVLRPDGSSAVVSRGTAERPLRTPNYPVFHPTGILYVSDSGVWERDDGAIYRIQPDGVTEIFSDLATRFPNGMAVSPDGDWLYVVESTLPGVSRLRINGDGTSGRREVVATLPGDVPDGVQFDEAGHLFISLYAPSRIYRLEPGGRIRIYLDDPSHVVLASPTNIAFGGALRRQLVIACLGRWHIGAIQAETSGCALHYPNPIGTP